MTTRSMLHRLARLERENAPDGCPVCGYAPGAKRRGFIEFNVYVPGVTEDCPDDPDPCPPLRAAAADHLARTPRSPVRGT